MKENLLPFPIDSLRPKPKFRLNDELALKVREIGIDLPDDLSLVELRIFPKYRESYPERGRRNYATNPPEEWKRFYDELDPQERQLLSRILNQSISNGFNTVGLVRQASMESLLNNPCFTEIGAAFLKNIF